MRPEVARALIKYGMLAPVLIWALWFIDKQQDRMFGDLLKEVKSISADVKAMNAKACADVCRDAAR